MRSEKDGWAGVFIYIQPPVQLNPDAVERYLAHGNLEPVERDLLPDADLQDVVVLGSNSEQTTIYASTNRKVEEAAQQAAAWMVKFLQFMGAQATLEYPQTHDMGS